MKFKVDDEIELQILQQHHAEALFKLVDANRKYLREWLPWVDGTKSSQDTLDFIDTTIAQFKNNSGFQAAIFFKSELAGAIGFHPINWMHLKCSLGYWIAQDFQGHGITTRCCRFLINYAFDQLALHRLEIHCGVGNKKSRAIAERLGFKSEGVLRECEKMSDGKHIDHAVYGMLVHDWKN